jgi:hypothetical protein
LAHDTLPSWHVPDDVPRVVVSSTARRHGGGPRRLPDRTDAHGVLAAVLVEDAEDAARVLRALDRPGRTLFVDVERKQAADLMALARDVVRHAAIHPAKPNDATIRSLDVVLTHVLGPDLAVTTAGVVGTGNLGLKSALLLGERGADVLVAGRSDATVARTAAAVDAVLPRYGTARVRAWGEERVDLLVAAVAAHGVVDSPWLRRLAPGAVVVDVGIDNLAGEFVEAALAAGHRLLRLDARAAESQVVLPAPGFLEGVLGEGEVAGVPVVSGGVLPARGTVIVDNVGEPGRALGVASGTGGLLGADELTAEDEERMERVALELRHRQARA